jgi:hypothetical protein
MDDDFTLVAIIAGIIIVLVGLFVWMKSRGRRRVVTAITPAQEALKLIPYIGGHPQLDTVWYAVRGQVSGLQVKIFGGKSRRSKSPGSIRGTGSMSTAVDSASVMIVVSMPRTIPFHISIQRKSALSSPSFGTSYPEFDSIVEVITENEKKTLTLLNNEQLRAAVASFIKKSAGNGFITTSEVMIKLSGGKQVLAATQEAVNVANILGQQIDRIQ